METPFSDASTVRNEDSEIDFSEADIANALAILRVMKAMKKGPTQQFFTDEPLHPAASTKACSNVYTGECSLLNTVVQTGYWKFDKMATSTIQSLIGHTAFTISNNFQPFSEHVKLLAQNLHLSSFLEGVEGMPISTVAVAAHITQWNLLASECLSTDTTHAGEHLLFYESSVVPQEDAASLHSISTIDTAVPGSVLFHPTVSNKRRVVDPSDLAEFNAAKNTLYAYLYARINAQADATSLRSITRKSFEQQDPFGVFMLLHAYFVRISGISIVKHILDLLSIKDDAAYAPVNKALARIEELKSLIERKRVNIPDIVYMAILILCIKDQALSRHLNLEITKHLQSGTEYTLLQATEFTRSYSADQNDLKSISDREKLKPNEDKVNKGAAKRTEGEPALATVTNVASKNCRKCQQLGKVIEWSKCMEHNFFLKRKTSAALKKSSKSSANVIITGQSLEDIDIAISTISESHENEYAVAMDHALAATIRHYDEVIVDTACTKSIQPDAKYMSDVKILTSNRPIVTVGNGAQEVVNSRGKYLSLTTNVSKNIKFRLLSVPQLDEELGAVTIAFNGRMTSFVPTDKQRVLLDKLLSDTEAQHLYDAKRNAEGLYTFPAEKPISHVQSVALVNIFPRMHTNNIDEGVYFMHLCLGHMPKAQMIYVSKRNLIKNLPSWFTPDTINKHWIPCKACLQAFMKVIPLVVPQQPRVEELLQLDPVETNKRHSACTEQLTSTRCGEVMSIDGWGPYIPTYSGYRWVNVAICTFSNYPIIQLARTQGKKEDFCKYVVEVAARDGIIVGNFRVDSQFVTEKILSFASTAYLPNAGIHVQQAAPGEHRTNPQAERFCQTSARRVSATMLTELAAGTVTDKAWGYAFLDTVFKLKLCPLRKHDYQTTPYEQWHRQKFDWDNARLLPFFMPVYAHIPDERLTDGKLSGHAFAGNYVGTVPYSKHCVYVLNSNTLRTNVRRSITPAVESPFENLIVENDPEASQVLLDGESIDEQGSSTTEGADDSNQVNSTTEGANDKNQVNSTTEGADNQKQENSIIDDVNSQHDYSMIDQIPLDSTEPAITLRERDIPSPPIVIRKSARLSEKEASRARKFSRDRIAPAVHAKRFHKVLVMYEKLNLGLTRRMKRSKKLYLRQGLMSALVTKCHDPTTLAQAQKSENAAEWEAARAAEDNSLKDRGTFKDLTAEELKDLRQRKVKILKSKYVFKTCRHADGSLKKFKVRLCVRGDLQDPSTYSDVYAGTVQRKAVFLLLAIANHKDLEIATADISSAFLYPELKEELYLELPDGRVVRLLKALYGLKQAANAFLNHLREKLIDIGFKQMMSDTCTFRLDEGDAFITLATHVDDLLFISNSKALIFKVKESLAKDFELTFYEEANEFLGITILRDRARKLLRLSQTGYVEKILATFKLPHSERISRTPHILSALRGDTNAPTTAEEKQLYMQITGSLLYLAISTRPDILASVHNLTRHMQTPTQADLIAAYRVLRYLLLTPDLCLTFKGDTILEVIGYADSSFTRNERNQFGFCFQLGKLSGCFVSVVKRTTKSAESSTESEYYALCEGCRELLWIKSFTQEIGFGYIPVKVIKQDNKSCMSYASKLGVSDRMKHVDLEYTFVKTLVHEGRVKIEYLCTKDMLADIFTKNLPVDSFEYLRDRILGITEL